MPETRAMSDEDYVEQAWRVLQVGNVSAEEEACWVLLERERKMHTPVVIAEISINALVAEVKQW